MSTNDAKALPGEHPLEYACRVSAESRLHYGVATRSDTFDPGDVAEILRDLDSARARIVELERERDEAVTRKDRACALADHYNMAGEHGEDFCNADCIVCRLIAERDAAHRQGWEQGRDAVALKIERDENRALDEYYCCSAMDGSVQICGCCAITIRQELVGRIRALPYPAPAEQPESDADLPTHEDVRGLLKEERCPLCGEADDELCSHGFHAESIVAGFAEGGEEGKLTPGQQAFVAAMPGDAEADEWCERWLRMVGKASAAESRALAAEADAARLREALKPFAHPPLYIFDEDLRWVLYPQPKDWLGGGWFSTDDFRRVRAALSPEAKTPLHLTGIGNLTGRCHRCNAPFERGARTTIDEREWAASPDRCTSPEAKTTEGE